MKINVTWRPTCALHCVPSARNRVRMRLFSAPGASPKVLKCAPRSIWSWRPGRARSPKPPRSNSSSVPALQELEREAAEAATRPAVPADAPPFSPRAASAIAAAEFGADRSVAEELRSLRNLLEQQVAALAWNDFTRREPLKARSLADLATLGIERTLALQIVAELPAALTDEQAQRTPYAVLARRIQTCTPPVERSGVLALIGPPGSGKTTTLSKLAARYVLEQDAANLVLISADDERLGSHEQLRSLGRVLGARVETVTDPDALEARIKSLPGRMILIDTPGAAGRDSNAAARFTALRSRCAALQLMLVLPSSAQSGVVDEP